MDVVLPVGVNRAQREQALNQLTTGLRELPGVESAGGTPWPCGRCAGSNPLFNTVTATECARKELGEITQSHQDKGQAGLVSTMSSAPSIATKMAKSASAVGCDRAIQRLAA